MRGVRPIEPSWFGRGKSVDGFCIERFHGAHRADSRGRVIEVGDRNYTVQFDFDTQAG